VFFAALTYSRLERRRPARGRFTEVLETKDDHSRFRMLRHQRDQTDIGLKDRWTRSYGRPAGGRGLRRSSAYKRQTAVDYQAII